VNAAVVLVIIGVFIFGGFSIFEYNQAFGLSSETIGFPIGSHDQSKWYGPMPNNGLGSLDKPMRFVNNDSETHHIILGSPHESTYDGQPNNSFDEYIEPGETFSYYFTKEGTYDWHCEFHPWMNGNVRIGVWKDYYPTDLELNENQKKFYHKVWSTTNKLTFSDFQGTSPQIEDYTAAIVVEFDFDANFEYTKHIPCEYRFDSIDVIALFNKQKSTWWKDHSDYVLNHEQRHFDVGEVVARQSEDLINSKYGGQTFACVSGFNNEIRNLISRVEQEAYNFNTIYDDAVDHGAKGDLQRHWDVKIDCMLEKRQFDQSCTSLTAGTTSSYQTAPKVETTVKQEPVPTYTPPVAKYTPPTSTTQTIEGVTVNTMPGSNSKTITLSGVKITENTCRKITNEVTGSAKNWISPSKSTVGTFCQNDQTPRQVFKISVPATAESGSYDATIKQSRCKNTNSNDCQIKYYKNTITVAKPLWALPSDDSKSSSTQTKSTASSGAPDIGKFYVMTDKQSFYKGSPVTISGNLGKSSNTPILLQIFTSSGKNSFTAEIPVSSDGSFGYTISTDNSGFVYTGKYTVVAKHSTQETKIDFEITSQPSDPIIPERTFTEQFVPTDPEFDKSVQYNDQAILAWENGNFDQAIESINNALSIYPDDESLTSNKIHMLFDYAYYAQEDGNWSESITTLKQIIELDPRNVFGVTAISYNYLAIAYDELGDPRKALEYNQKALALEPFNDILQDYTHTLNEQVNSLSQREKVPGWVKNNAQWWVSGQIKDNDFVQGIEHLVKEEIISVPAQSTSATKNTEIPGWVKTQTEWWANGQITEDEFLNSIEYLIKQGIVNVSSETDKQTTVDTQKESKISINTDSNYNKYVGYANPLIVTGQILTDENFDYSSKVNYYLVTPSGSKYGSGSNFINADGTFNFEIDLNNSIKTGLYTLNVSYNEHTASQEISIIEIG